LYSIASVKQTESQRLTECPNCEGETFQRWGEVTKQVKDTKNRTAKLYRYRCTNCKRTFLHYPQGIGRAMQSEWMKQLAVICWFLGLSYRGMEANLSAFGVSLSRMSGWINVQAGADQTQEALEAS
jgi:transposase-like protein